MPGFAFISYSRTDREYVVELAQALARAGVSTWYDYEIQVGDQFPLRIQKAIDDCSAFILVLSPESVASKWVQRELARAARLDKPLLPLLLRPCGVPIELEGIHREDVIGGRTPARTFVDRLASLTRGSGIVRTELDLTDE